MEQVASDYHEVWFKLNCSVHKFSKRVVEVLASCFKTVLGVTQVQIGCVDKTESFQTLFSLFKVQLEFSLVGFKPLSKQALKPETCQRKLLNR